MRRRDLQWYVPQLSGDYGGSERQARSEDNAAALCRHVRCVRNGR